MNRQYTEDELQKAKNEAVRLLLRPNGNIVGVGIGKKEVDGKTTQDDCIRVYVASKLYEQDLTPAAAAPSSVLGVPTDIIEVQRFGRKGYASNLSEIAATGPDAGGGAGAPNPDGPVRVGTPIRVRIPPETDAPNVNQGSIGTLGALVKDVRPDANNRTRTYILSCNHVLASNGRVPDTARIVSAQFIGKEPLIATPVLADLARLANDEGNSVDCALALLSGRYPVLARPEDPRLALTSSDPQEPARGMKVKKVGASTGVTSGKIVDVDADLYVNYSFGTFLFERQVIIDGYMDDQHGDFALAGDSGSIVFEDAEESRRATAMIFAASGRFGVACPITEVLKKLDVSIIIDDRQYGEIDAPKPSKYKEGSAAAAGTETGS